MLKFFKDNFSTILSIIFSLISLVISFITLWSNRKHLDVVIENELGDIDDIFYNFNDFRNDSAAMNFGKGKICFIKIVNPSPKDIAFFDLRIVDMDTLKPIFFLTNGVLESIDCANRSIFSPVGEALAHLNYPNANYGILKSNSFTRFDIPFYPDTKNSTVLVSFKVAISTFSNNKESSYRKSFKYYKKVFNCSL